MDVKRSIDAGEKRFNQLSIEERGKFDEETLVNVNSIKRQSTSSQRSSGFSNEYIVVSFSVLFKFYAVFYSTLISVFLIFLAALIKSMCLEYIYSLYFGEMCGYDNILLRT